MRISDTIEQFIKELLDGETQPEIDLKRNELAEYFHCSPSQINYVLSTRFTPDHGYLISSQRGGGGYIRIVRLVRSRNEQMHYLFNERIGASISAQDIRNLCQQLQETHFLSGEQSALIQAATSDSTLAVPLPENVKNVLRSRIFKSMLLNIAQAQAANSGVQEG